ncbi:hypothetical protein HAX54_049002 [Datura stramonium]|uniref:Uncharacterized protein n=1 Tax=Datura stramonium TaxID=4076 RepID=A0ABS8SUZ0_DATST|nr:hypothetical protein [Datura stramonium]
MVRVGGLTVVVAFYGRRVRSEEGKRGGGEKRKARGEGWFPIRGEWRREKSGGGFWLGGNGEEKRERSGGEVVLWWFFGKGDGRLDDVDGAKGEGKGEGEVQAVVRGVRREEDEG